MKGGEPRGRPPSLSCLVTPSSACCGPGSPNRTLRRAQRPQELSTGCAFCFKGSSLSELPQPVLSFLVWRMGTPTRAALVHRAGGTNGRHGRAGGCRLGAGLHGHTLGLLGSLLWGQWGWDKASPPP